jgi:hypothetical protein
MRNNNQAAASIPSIHKKPCECTISHGVPLNSNATSKKPYKDGFACKNRLEAKSEKRYFD